MASVNKVILVGNLGKDPEIKTFESGKKSASFSLATTESFKNKDGQKIENTEWHNIVVWGTLADICEKYLKKGSQIYLEGKIKTRTWEDKSGTKKYITEIFADTIQFLSKNDKSENGNSTKQENTSTPDESDDLPF